MFTQDLELPKDQIPGRLMGAGPTWNKRNEQRWALWRGIAPKRRDNGSTRRKEMDPVERAYHALRELGLAKSQYDFSQRWLGQCPSYYSATKARGSEPSMKSLLFLDLQLQLMRTAIARTPNSAYAHRGAVRLGEAREAVSLRVRERVAA
jgi:hypothetical protein